jgi:two-component system OmpR family sensor kinase
MNRERRQVVLVCIAACCALVLAVLGMAFLCYPRASWSLLRRYNLVLAVALAVAVLVGYVMARYALALSTRTAARDEARLRRYLSETGHGLRTPLAVMAASIDALRRTAPPADAAGHTLLDGLQHEVARMSALVRDVLLLARLDVARRSSSEVLIDLDAMLAELAREARQVAPGLDLQLDARSGARVRADPIALREALRNLIDNACKYAPGAKLELGAARAGAQALISVRDHGPGMDADDNALAFERYYRGASAQTVEGSGLGLSIAQAAVRAAGGRIEMISAPGAGTTLRLFLPVTDWNQAHAT